MELLGMPKTGYLLDASLETLHKESREWLNELAFWNKEITFFYKLIHLREQPIPFPTVGLADLERELVQINSEQGILRVQVENHERILGNLVINNSHGEEHEFRIAHRDLHDYMREQISALKSFRKDIFSFVKRS